MALVIERREASDGRDAARAVLAGLLAAQVSTYVPHPGELDWWLFHADPRHEPLELHVGTSAVALLDRTRREATLVGALEALAPWSEVALGPGPVTVTGVSDRDVAAQTVLAARGYRPDTGGMPVFEMDLAARIPVASDVPDGVTIRPLAGPEDDEELASRADAARLSFESTMEPAVHRARYRRFVASPAYDRARDVVAVDPAGEVCSFAVWWPDPLSGIGQFEPVGTRPGAQGRGLARAVLEQCLRDMRAVGMHTARVCTQDHREPAIGLYAGTGFTPVDHLTWWTRP